MNKLIALFNRKTHAQFVQQQLDEARRARVLEISRKLYAEAQVSYYDNLIGVLENEIKVV